jgi:hypothetical protein
MSGDAKIRKLGGFQPKKDELTKGGAMRRQPEVGLDGYQPTLNGEARGYRPTQAVDVSNLKIPKNLGTAAVKPENSGGPARTPVQPR